MSVNWFYFNALVVVYFIVLNAMFASVYLAAGIENINGIFPSSTFENFLNAFYFSVQTFISVGYGNFSPEGHAVHIISSFEAIFGLLSFALATGLLYARFSRPKSKIRFSKQALITTVNGKQAFIFRLVNTRKSALMEMSCRLLFTTINLKNELKRNYYQLDLEIDKINFSPLTWMVVHYITDDSPLFGKSHDELIDLHPEFMVLTKGFDETFSQEVHSRYSYVAGELEWNKKFVPCFKTQKDGSILLDISKIDQVEDSDF